MSSSRENQAVGAGLGAKLTDKPITFLQNPPSPTSHYGIGTRHCAAMVINSKLL
ncbi:hypothetical protein MC7420_6505 [Coleofasciculus chthonoplastes PCC 7420]|uniref:Uncharacterized protein n=1 Tax=Coleofasciculus chthonoplastes PCC 7420 TaxID=118168 RepID=B4VQK6_9CYAN|nr:hypothetical protein MC7420_6505 [Coleofasciculus chthonoplastes PCC 7420]